MHRITITIPDPVLEALEEWRARQRPIPPLSRAIVTLVAKSLNLSIEEEEA